ncbi:hypothetical protein [Sporisorium scitamineum]|uniref:Uncharacterized protein n=1 Tax=Sporisorium scitamineum TaxID=49012 RepID=A0A0F7RSC0_9BASI|nr:hypothetical protein [Sporisorium scitamineum]
MAMHAQLRLQADFNWASLTPAEAAALPWYSTQFALKPIHYWRTGGSGASTQYKYGVEPPHVLETPGQAIKLLEIASTVPVFNWASAFPPRGGAIPGAIPSCQA